MSEIFSEKKHILLVYYSQSGQLARIVDALAAPLRASSAVSLEVHALQPQKPYPFPWKFTRFFNTFPETVHLQPAATVIGCRNMWLTAQEK